MPNKLFLVLASVLALLGIVTLFLPGEYTVERRVVIAAQPNAIYPHLVDLREWPNWSVWSLERDPTAVWSFEGQAGAGMRWSWQGEAFQAGRLVLTDVEQNARVNYEIDTGPLHGRGNISLRPTADGTELTWVGSGDLGLLWRWFRPLIDSALGSDFEAGLAKLKQRIEGGSHETP